MAKDKSVSAELVSREYTINLGKRLHNITFKKRAPRALKEIRKFASQQMNTKEVSVDPKLNKAVWSQVGVARGCPGLLPASARGCATLGGGEFAGGTGQRQACTGLDCASSTQSREVELAGALRSACLAGPGGESCWGVHACRNTDLAQGRTSRRVSTDPPAVPAGVFPHRCECWTPTPLTGAHVQGIKNVPRRLRIVIERKRSESDDAEVRLLGLGF